MEYKVTMDDIRKLKEMLDKALCWKIIARPVGKHILYRKSGTCRKSLIAAAEQ